MKRNLFYFQTSYKVIIIFWVTVLAILLGIYFFAPSVFNQMRQASYQDTPYINLPNSPAG